MYAYTNLYVQVNASEGPKSDLAAAENSRKVINRFESDTYQNRENLTNAELDQISVATLKKFAAMVSIS
jgi:hypothetical protein